MWRRTRQRATRRGTAQPVKAAEIPPLALEYAPVFIGNIDAGLAGAGQAPKRLLDDATASARAARPRALSVIVEADRPRSTMKRTSSSGGVCASASAGYKLSA